jgi:hypothetical protein
VFRFAVATGLAERDVKADLKGALASGKANHFAAITESDAVTKATPTPSTWWKHRSVRQKLGGTEKRKFRARYNEKLILN